MLLLWILRLIVLWLVIRAILRLARGIAEGLAEPRQSAAMPLVRDPICGTFVVPANALSAGTGAQMRFFCSENCRRAYEVKRAR